jgi:hypothetical protein
LIAVAEKRPDLRKHLPLADAYLSKWEAIFAARDQEAA